MALTRALALATDLRGARLQCCLLQPTLLRLQFLRWAAFFDESAFDAMTAPHLPSRRILSCGIVAVHFDGLRYRLLALRASNGWDFPKALLIDDEDPLQVALAAAREATGLTELELSWGEDAFRETIAFDNGNVSRYYLAQSKTAEVALHPPPGADRNTLEYRWVTPEEAEDILPPRLGLILDWAVEQLAAGAR